MEFTPILANVVRKENPSILFEISNIGISAALFMSTVWLICWNMSLDEQVKSITYSLQNLKCTKDGSESILLEQMTDHI